MAELKWSTVIESRELADWEFFSQQATKPGERQLTDEQYLSALRERYPKHRLRIRPEETEDAEAERRGAKTEL